MSVIRYERMIHSYGSGTTQAGEIRPPELGWHFPSLSFEGEQLTGHSVIRTGEGQCNSHL